MLKPLATIFAILWFPLFARGEIIPGSKDLGAIWLVGDSITQGNGDADDSSTPRSALYDLLTDNGFTFSFTGHHVVNGEGIPVTGDTPDTNLYGYHSGISGFVISNLASRLATDWEDPNGRLNVAKPNVAMIMLGTNDINNQVDYRRVPLPNTAPERMENYIDAIYDQPGVGNLTLFLANIPPIRTRDFMPERVDAFNAEIPNIVAEQRLLGRDVHFVDMYNPLNDDYETLMRSDNLHPNGAGNLAMATQWFNGVQSAATVPEPASTTGLLFVGIFFAMGWRRRVAPRQ